MTDTHPPTARRRSHRPPSPALAFAPCIWVASSYVPLCLSGCKTHANLQHVSRLPSSSSSFLSSPFHFHHASNSHYHYRLHRDISPPPFPVQTIPPSVISMSTEDIFAVDAGRDLFFVGMDEGKAIEILDEPLGSLSASDDRFIAAERLKFFPSSASTQALLSFVERFDLSRLDSYVLEERVARRKAVETLGRMKGQFFKMRVVDFLKRLLNDPDHYLIETAVWSLAEVGVAKEPDVLRAVADVLKNEHVDKRVIVHTLLKAKYIEALPTIRKLATEADEVRLMCAARAATAVLTAAVEKDEGGNRKGEEDGMMKDVVGILKDTSLNNRRCAIEDITLARYVPALEAICVCPNSLVLRSRTARVLLDTARERDGEMKMSEDTLKVLDRLIWDHPNDLDLLGVRKDTKKGRDLSRNVTQLYKNDALYAYVACRTLAEDYRGGGSNMGIAGEKVLKSYNDLKYFDYFGAYHVYKTLGWLQYEKGLDLVLENARELPPRFFNHKAGAITALAEMVTIEGGKKRRDEALQAVRTVACESRIWELTYACVMAADRMGDGGELKRRMAEGSEDWVVRERCNSGMDFSHLRNDF